MTQPSPLSDSPTVAKNPSAIKAEGAALGVRSVLRVAARHAARSLAVCRAGGLVAFHFQTAVGEVIVTATEANFNAACRGPRDHNGNAFVAPVVQLAAADLPQSAPKVERTRRGVRSAGHYRRPPELIAKFEACMAYRKANQVTWPVAAAHFGLSSTQVENYACQCRRESRGILTPAPGAPILKPSGQLL